MQIVNIYDFILLPVYLLIFFYIAKRKANTLQSAELKKYYLTAFALRMLGSVAYSMLVAYYYGYGDSFTYYSGSDFIHKQLVKDFSNIKYLFASASEFQQWYNMEEGDMGFSGYTAIAANNSVMKIAGLLSFLSFNKFVIISLFFGLFSFAGQWRLFTAFDNYNKGVNTKLMAYAVLYTPSIWFWGSGLMKDSLCLGATGYIISILYNTFINKKISLRDWLLLPVFIFMIFVIKNYIIAALVAGLAIAVFVRYILRVKNILARIAAIVAFVSLTGVFLYFGDFTSEINAIVEESYTQIQSYQQNYKNIQAEDQTSKAGLELGNLDASLSGILLKSPGVIFTCLYRPFLWESKKIIILFTSLESTLLLLATIFLLFKSRITGFFKICFSNGFILLSLVVSLIFALIIGFTTFNFGTMIRYKIILLPFYYFMLVAVYTRIQPQKEKTVQPKNSV